MPPKYTRSPKTRRQRADSSRQLRSRRSSASAASTALSSAKAKNKPAAQKKSAPLCKTCTTGQRQVHHHWTQCPRKKDGVSAPAKASKVRKSARSLETDTRQAALLAEVANSSARLLEFEDDNMSVDSDGTTGQEPEPARELSISLGPPSDTSSQDVADDGAEDDDESMAASNDDSDSDQDDDDEDDVSMAGSNDGHRDGDSDDQSMSGSDDPSDADDEDEGEDDADAPVAVVMSDFFSDEDVVPDSEPARAAARAAASAAARAHAAREEPEAGAESATDGDTATQESDDDSQTGSSSHDDDDDASEVGGRGSIQASAASDDSSSDTSSETSSESGAGSASATDDEAQEDDNAIDGDENEGTDGEAAIDGAGAAYFNQAAYVGRIDSDDDMDSESRVKKLGKTVEADADVERVKMHRQLENPSPAKIKEQQALLAEARATAPAPKDDAAALAPAPKDDAAAVKRRQRLRALLAMTPEEREADEVAEGSSTLISNGWKGNSAVGESITYKRNTPQRWARVNKTHKTVKHDFKPMMQSMVQKGEYLADCLGASVMIIAMPKGGLGNAHTWHSDQIEVDAPGLPQAMRDLWFQQLAGARQHHVGEMAAAMDALRVEQEKTRNELIELNRENAKLKRRLAQAAEKLRNEREAPQ